MTEREQKRVAELWSQYCDILQSATDAARAADALTNAIMEAFGDRGDEFDDEAFIGGLHTMQQALRTQGPDLGGVCPPLSVPLSALAAPGSGPHPAARQGGQRDHGASEDEDEDRLGDDDGSSPAGFPGLYLEGGHRVLRRWQFAALSLCAVVLLLALHSLLSAHWTNSSTLAVEDMDAVHFMEQDQGPPRPAASMQRSPTHERSPIEPASQELLRLQSVRQETLPSWLPSTSAVQDGLAAAMLSGREPLESAHAPVMTFGETPVAGSGSSPGSNTAGPPDDSLTNDGPFNDRSFNQSTHDRTTMFAPLRLAPFGEDSVQPLPADGWDQAATAAAESDVVITAQPRPDGRAVSAREVLGRDVDAIVIEPRHPGERPMTILVRPALPRKQDVDLWRARLLRIGSDIDSVTFELLDDDYARAIDGSGSIGTIVLTRRRPSPPRTPGSSSSRGVSPPQ
ncbi:hypothetical protein [Haliangium sp.]|uniref:hypothetical protein n=1 Tax=Haliangium sp. TaxID=2663208 RepID=UPI003D1009C1